MNHARLRDAAAARLGVVPKFQNNFIKLLLALLPSNRIVIRVQVLAEHPEDRHLARDTRVLPAIWALYCEVGVRILQFAPDVCNFQLR